MASLTCHVVGGAKQVRLERIVRPRPTLWERREVETECVLEHALALEAAAASIYQHCCFRRARRKSEVLRVVEVAFRFFQRQDELLRRRSGIKLFLGIAECSGPGLLNVAIQLIAW